MTKLIIKSTLLFGFIFLLYLSINFLYLRSSSIENIKNNLDSNGDRIIQDLIYKNKKWDTSVYVNDSSISYDNPEYIFTTEGFVVDRTNIINGFLDTSDLNYALSFKTPRTIESPAGEEWRVYSKSITRNGNLTGAIIVGFYNPSDKITTDLDQELLNGAEEINSKIEPKGDSLDVSKIETKNLVFTGAFEIVDKFNGTLRSEGGIPASIDRSLVKKYLRNDYFGIKDKNTGKDFLISTKPIIKEGSIIGLLALGYPLNNLNLVLNNQLIFSIISSIGFLLFIFLFYIYIFRKEISILINQGVNEILKPKVIKIDKTEFDEKKSCIIINGTEVIYIGADTYQHDLCKTFFSKPNRKWENDELLEVVGDDFGEGKARKIYDAVLAINKKFKSKTGKGLVEYKSKQYQLDPNLI